MNTASRLEALTTELGSSIAISDRVADRLTDATRSRLAPGGVQPPEGKAAPQTAYSA